MASLSKGAKVMHEKLQNQRFYEQNRKDFGGEEPDLIEQNKRNRKLKELKTRAFQERNLLSQMEDLCR